jgi:hypothetical protein
MHGTQSLEPSTRDDPTSYYTETSGIGRLLEVLHPRLEPLRVGVIGLGAGTLAAYGAKGDIYRFYDINAEVIKIANATSRSWATARRRSRRCSAMRGSISSASRRSASTCSRSMLFRATRFPCT